VPSQLSASQTFTVVVLEDNTPPALAPVEAIRNFLDANNVAPAAAAVTGADAAKGSVVRVICVRK